MRICDIENYNSKDTICDYMYIGVNMLVTFSLWGFRGDMLFYLSHHIHS